MNLMQKPDRKINTTAVTFFCLLLAVVVALPLRAGEPVQPKTEILWDAWGVPHIFSRDTDGMFYAFGWAQMHSHGDLIMKLYGQARGRSMEYWGDSKANRSRDIFIRKMGTEKRARQWLKAYSPDFHNYLKAFIQGMNDYAAKHPDRFEKSSRLVLPLVPEDVMAHAIRVIHYVFTGGGGAREIDRWGKKGSNAWAIGPKRSASGHAMLLMNPHLPWSDFYLFYEAQLTAPGIDAYGVTLVGMPMLSIAFNDNLGWSHTVNMNDGADVYRLKLVEGGYLFDGKTKAFETETQVMKIKTGDKTFKEEKLSIKRSVHGPVLAVKGSEARVLRVAGLDRPFMFKQWFDMCKATNFGEFEKAMKQLQIPMFNTIYADREGHIMLLHNAVLPRRPKGDWNFWKGVVPGDTSETMWMGYHGYDALPRIVDPVCGWVQNANEPPWTTTHPVEMKPGSYPSYISMPLSSYKEYGGYFMRALRSMRMLLEDSSITFDELITYKFSNRLELADRVLPDLLAAAKKSRDDSVIKAAKVLEAWDRTTDADSKGGVLFQQWAGNMGRNWLARSWNYDDFNAGPGGIKDPTKAVQALKTASENVLKEYGSLDVAWGQVNRFRIGNKDFPGNGGPGRLGAFRVIYFDKGKDGKSRAESGDTFVGAVEFSNPVKAQVILNYGNSSQPDSPHRGDQLEMASKKKMRPALRKRSEIEKHLEKREVF